MTFHWSRFLFIMLGACGVGVFMFTIAWAVSRDIPVPIIFFGVVTVLAIAVSFS